jgi:transposase
MAIDRDFRKLDASAQAEARRIAVTMVKAGRTRIEAAAAVGVNRRFVGEWVKAEKAGGAAALLGGKRGRLPGEQKALQADEEKTIRKLIADRCPDQLKLPFALWTREAVRALIERKTCKRLSLSAIGRYLRAWGFTAQRPIRRATERCEADVQSWINDEYPEIAARAKAEKAEIQWADETGLSNQANYGKSFAPKGETPVIPRPAARFSQSMISSLTNQGKLRFMVYEGALNASIFLEFLKRLVKDAGSRKIFLIVDNLRPHRAKIVTAWVAANADKIELFYLPPYAPDRNPDEFLNNDMKQEMARRATPKTKGAMKSGLTSYMRSLQKRPAKVKAFFQAPSVRYAA